MESNAKGFAFPFDWELLQHQTQAEGGFAADVRKPYLFLRNDDERADSTLTLSLESIILLYPGPAHRTSFEGVRVFSLEVNGEG